MTRLPLLATLAAALMLGACTEKAQTAGTKQHDGKAWDGVAAGQAADAGWKVGDKAAWEAHLRTRTQRGQNEYPRMPATP